MGRWVAGWLRGAGWLGGCVALGGWLAGWLGRLGGWVKDLEGP